MDFTLSYHHFNFAHFCLWAYIYGPHPNRQQQSHFSVHLDIMIWTILKSPKHFFGPPLSPPVYPKPRYFSWRLPKVTAQPANRAHHVLIGGAKVKVGLGGDIPNHKEVNKEDMEGSWNRHQDLFFPVDCFVQAVATLARLRENWINWVASPQLGAACFLLKL